MAVGGMDFVLGMMVCDGAVEVGTIAGCLIGLDCFRDGRVRSGIMIEPPSVLDTIPNGTVMGVELVAVTLTVELSAGRFSSTAVIARESIVSDISTSNQFQIYEGKGAAKNLIISTTTRANGSERKFIILRLHNGRLFSLGLRFAGSLTPRFSPTKRFFRGFYARH